MDTSTNIPNPPVETVLRILMDEMAVGSPLPICEDGRNVLIAYRTSFERRLEEAGRWQQEGGAVRHAARQLGVIASAIASLRREVEVSQTSVQEAARVVEAHCSIGTAGRGRWCSREP